MNNEPLTMHRREALVKVLKGARLASVDWFSALAGADNRTLVMAVEECILSHHAVLVNRRRIKLLLETLMDRVALVPPMELTAQQAAVASAQPSPSAPSPKRRPATTRKR